jgi:NAD(P)-dependent dehydrogenase (short-subunit alcohol dehydrogenase family)
VSDEEERERPPQEQERPGLESEMEPEPQSDMRGYAGSGKLAGRKALVTGGDSGIGRAVCVGFAKEGADVAFGYLSEDSDAERTRELIEENGRKAVPIRADLSEEGACEETVARAREELGGLDTLVLHHGTQWVRDSLEEITTEQWETTMRTNLTSFFWVTRAALPHLGEGSSIVMTGSVNGFRGNDTLIDYAVSKGGIHTLAQSLAQSLLDRGIRVNVVAPGPVWTPLIPATFPAEKVEKFGQQAPMERAAQPDEIAPSYVFLASNELSGYYSGQTLGAIGGEVHPG